MSQFYTSILILMMLTYSSCYTPQCHGSDQYELLMSYHSFLEQNYDPETPLSGKFLSANEFLSVVTGKATRASYGDISYYEKKNHFDLDLKDWKRWIGIESCSLEVDVLNRREKEFNLTIQAIEN